MKLIKRKKDFLQCLKVESHLFIKQHKIKTKGRNTENQQEKWAKHKNIHKSEKLIKRCIGRAFLSHSHW